MENPKTARLHLELDLEFTDPAAVQDHAIAWAQENSGNDGQTLSGMVEQAGESAESALMMLVEPSDVLANIPGVEAVGATMWVQALEDDGGGPAEPESGAFPDMDGFTDGADATFDASFDAGGVDDDSADGEDEWLEKIFNDAARIPGLDLERLGYDLEESNPDVRGRQLHQATMLRGAINWAYISLVDELFEDLALLRESTEAAAETQQIANLPPLHSASYGPLFAQQFLAITFDLGTALATTFGMPSCVAQELALKLVLDQVEALESMLPNLGLAEDWRTLADDSLYEDLDHALLYDPAMDGISASAAVESLGMADLNLSAWFTPFHGCAVNPYAAAEE